MRHGIVLILLFISSTLFAQQNSLLWKISGHGLSSPSYIYGTIHSFDKRAFTFKLLAENYIKETKAFGMEIKLDELNPFSLLGQLQMPGDTTIKMLLNESEYTKLEKILRDSFQIELTMFSTIKPMFLVGLLEMPSGEPVETNSDFLDEYLMNQAKKLNKEVIGIETVEEQLHAVDLIPLKEQAKMLVDELVTPDSTHPPLQDLLDVYSIGNLDSLYSYYQQGELSNTFNKALVLDRNHRMADRIDSIAKKKSIFVAVGALHLPGEEGVLNLLRKKGYDITPVYYKKEN
ncbi:MAG TPA: TraB/GumN family protein [Candidatus Kapabacteria bacterium]|nr:TraB/GumN family protein [Candidatus Kapabacteria bacterium]